LAVCDRNESANCAPLDSQPAISVRRPALRLTLVARTQHYRALAARQTRTNRLTTLVERLEDRQTDRQTDKRGGGGHRCLHATDRCREQ